MSSVANELKVEPTRDYGAEVDLEAPTHHDAYERMLELIEETGRVFVHPFDDPLVSAGQGTVGLELVENAPDVDVVILPVGSGALISGIPTAATGLRHASR